MWETWVWSLGQEDSLQKGMATHSSILVWRIPWTEEPGELHSMELQRFRHDWAINTHIHICIQPPSLQRLSGKCGFQPASLRSTGRCPGRNCWVPNDHIQPHFPYFNIWDLLNPPTWLLINKHWLGKRALSPPRFPPPSFLQGDGRIVDSELRFGKWKQEQAWIIE